MFFQQFEKFDPLTGDVPAHPFTNLPEIARRARSILIGRNKDQIASAAKRIDAEIERYFSDLKTQAVDELQAKLQDNQEEFLRFFEWDGKNSWSGRWSYKDEMDEELEIPTAMNSSEVDALKTIIENRDSCFFLPKGQPLPDVEHWQEGQTHELFAVLSLWLLADAIDWSQNKMKNNLSVAGEYAISAMDAVCFAEHVREVDWAEQFHKKCMIEISDRQENRIKGMVDGIRKDLAAEQIAHASEKQARRSERLNIARHAKSNHAKEIVCKEWEKIKNDFSSAEKAGEHFADWVVAQGLLKKVADRTVRDWILDHAKKIGVRFRL